VSAFEWLSIIVALFACFCVALWITGCWCNEWRIRNELSSEERDNYRDENHRLLYEVRVLRLERQHLRDALSQYLSEGFHEAELGENLLAIHAPDCGPIQCSQDYGAPVEETSFSCPGCDRRVGLCMGCCDDNSSLCDDCANRVTDPGEAA
jgi:hypothetical protein